MPSPHPASGPPPLRLIITHAAPAGGACRQALPGLRLPNLARLLARLAPVDEARQPQATGVDADTDTDAGLSTLSLPHERALARALGLPDADGHIPWAAWERLQANDPQAQGHAWAWLTPCHWAVGSDHIAMRPPQALELSAEESRQLLEAMQPYFREDGLEVVWEAPLRWRARGEMLRPLPCASLDRVVGRPVDPWLPRTAEARPLRRLQQEMQMLLYTHPVNEAREREGRLTVNSFWVEGAGTLPAAFAAPADTVVIRLDDRLREPALLDDAAAWQASWQQLDAQALPPLLAALDAGQPVCLTLGGERAAATYGPLPGGWAQRLLARWRAPSPAQALEPL